ncbi:hypothetical protein [Gordonia sp. DT101]|uniref:hypothetical protein n=1 Tax=Gordonia sp. DT101 TaxID=3416545 RepID=UPI003CFB640D
MTDRIEDLDNIESINHYLAVTALVAEGRRDDAFALICSLEAHEQVDMWFAGCAITTSFARDCHQHHGIPISLPAWLRMIAATDVEDGAS